jgi:hypothetical protein
MMRDPAFQHANSEGAPARPRQSFADWPSSPVGLHITANVKWHSMDATVSNRL